MEATIEKREAVGLTEEKREATERLLEAFGKLTNEWDEEKAVTFIEGMAAAGTPVNRPPRATA